MKKVVTMLSLITTLLISLSGCQNRHLTKDYDLKKIFETFISDNCTIHASDLDDNKKQPIEMIFYKIDDKSYIGIAETMGISFERIKGYCEYDNYMIVYYGIDNTFAEEYLDLQYSGFEQLEKDYSNLDKKIVDLPKNRIKDYRIKNDIHFERFNPDESHLDKLENQLIDAGLVRLPPPPPPGY